MSGAVAVELPGIADVGKVQRHEVGDKTVIKAGSQVLFCYERSDTAMRNLAVVALTDAGIPGIEVAKVFALSAPYISRVRGWAKTEGGPVPAVTARQQQRTGQRGSRS